LRRADVPCECPLIGVDRKWLADRRNDANDPYATSAAERTRFIILYRSPRRFAAEPDYHRCDASQAIGQLRT
jgi:hypothetical protein